MPSAAEKVRAPDPSTARTDAMSDAIRDQGRPHDASERAKAPPLPFPTHKDSGSSPSPTTASSHTRAKSTAMTTAHTIPDLRIRSRARASSSATVGASSSRPRPRLPSMLASVLAKAPAQPRPAVHDPDLVGSFTPTSSPRPRLLSLLAGTDAGSSSGASSPEPSPPPSRFGTTQRIRARHQSDLRDPSRPPPTSVSAFASASASHPHPHAHSRSPPHIRPRSHTRPRPESSDGSPSPSPDLPSICRTPSSYSGSDYFPTAPSSAGPATPVHSIATLPVNAAGKPAADTLHPVLESLEQASKLRVRTACAACGTRGSNFPCCPKCGEMWCSRPCRLKNGDGKRHVCAKRTM